MDQIGILYKVSLTAGAFVNLLMAASLLAHQKDYRRYAVYYRARLFMVLWLTVFAVGYLLHAFLELRAFWPTGAGALTISYFHVGAICFCWGFIPLLNPEYLTRRVMIRDTLIYGIGLAGYWTAALIWRQSTVYAFVPYLVFFIYCACNAVLFYRTFHRVSYRLTVMSYGSVNDFVRWMQASCDIIIFFGIFCVAIVALFPETMPYVAPAETILGIGLFGYIVYSLVRYGRVADTASRATETVADLGPILVLVAALMLSAGCERFMPEEHVPDVAHADALLETAHRAHDNERIISLADSLEAAGDISRIKALYWRGYSYYSQWNNPMCQACWYEAINLEIKDQEDLAYYGRSANRLTDVMLSKGEFESATRFALEAIEKLREGGLTETRDYAYLLITLGCCELNNANKAAADAYFDESYRLLMRLIGSDGPMGGYSRDDNLKTAVAGLTTVSRHCLEGKYFSDALLWVDRFAAVMDEYVQAESTTDASMDRRLALVWIFRASALEGLGRHEEAAAAYEKALGFNFCSSPQGRVEAARYLILARRWNEAADNYRQLDGVVSIVGAGLTMENLQAYYLPKFRANFNARRDNDALATGIQLCDALDSAIVRSRNDKAAELATIYRTKEMQQQLLDNENKLQHSRYLSSIIVMILMALGFIAFVFFRYRSSIRLEKAYQRLEEANAHAQRASMVKTAFLQQISHEIRTPLNVITGFGQLLTTPGLELDEESREQINRGMVENTDRITDLVSKILALSDLVSKTELERGDAVTPAELAEEAAVKCKIREAKGIHFTIHAVKEAGEQKILTNRQAAMRILCMLLENAVKYTGEGSVTLHIVTKQSFVYFLVEDTGIGVPASEAEHIFESFVQLDDFRQGTGIGLSVARSLARRLGGDGTLDTSYTFGARFVFSLPKEVV